MKSLSIIFVLSLLLQALDGSLLAKRRELYTEEEAVTPYPMLTKVTKTRIHQGIREFDPEAPLEKIDHIRQDTIDNLKSGLCISNSDVEDFLAYLEKSSHPLMSPIKTLFFLYYTNTHGIYQAVPLFLKDVVSLDSLMLNDTDFAPFYSRLTELDLSDFTQQILFLLKTMELSSGTLEGTRINNLAFIESANIAAGRNPNDKRLTRMLSFVLGFYGRSDTLFEWMTSRNITICSFSFARGYIAAPTEDRRYAHAFGLLRQMSKISREMTLIQTIIE